MTYNFEGNLEVVNKNENRVEIIKAMDELHTNGLQQIRPADVAKYYGVSVNSKDGRRMSRTMQRMAEQFELTKGLKYGTYIYHNGKDENGNDIC